MSYLRNLEETSSGVLLDDVELSGSVVEVVSENPKFSPDK